MARGQRGPANSPLQSLQQQIDHLSARVRELETKRVLTAPVSSLDKTRDPVDGEHMVNHYDGTGMWFKGSDWRYGLPAISVVYLPQLIQYEPNPLDREWQAINTEVDPAYGFRNSECFYQDEDFPSRIFVRTPGTYLIMLYFAMTNVTDYHGFVDLDVEGDGRDPSDTTDIGSNAWFSSTSSVMSSGDPTLNPMIDPAQAVALTWFGVTSFAINSESALDEQYAEDNPDDDDEIEFPSYTRWFEAKVWNYGPDEFTMNNSNMTIIRLGNRQLTE